jgi:hypothetical protein
VAVQREGIGAAQSARIQLQSAQVPLVGPVEVPGRHPIPSHQPHPARAAHSSQVAAPSQSVGAEHSRGTHAQSAQLPSSGIASVPG